MSEYIYFSEEQKQRANDVDLVDFLLRQGEKLLPSGRDKRLSSDHSITVRGNKWYDHAIGKGGLAIDFVQMFYNMTFSNAVTMLLNGEQGQAYRPAAQCKPEPPKPFILPEANRDMRRVYAYLTKTRCISSNVITAFTKEKMIYEDAKYHNAVFIGYDSNGVARHAHKRGTYTKNTFKGNVDGSNPYYSFHYTGKSDTVYAFEAPIDMLSFITLYQKDWRNNSYVSFCCLAEHALLQLLKENPQVCKIGLCLDNDKAGNQARVRIKDILIERGYTNVFSLFPHQKDWNEDLQILYEQSATQTKDYKQNMQMVT